MYNDDNNKTKAILHPNEHLEQLHNNISEKLDELIAKIYVFLRKNNEFLALLFLRSDGPPSNFYSALFYIDHFCYKGSISTEKKIDTEETINKLLCEVNNKLNNLTTKEIEENYIKYKHDLAGVQMCNFIYDAYVMFPAAYEAAKHIIKVYTEKNINFLNESIWNELIQNSQNSTELEKWRVIVENMLVKIRMAIGK